MTPVESKGVFQTVEAAQLTELTAQGWELVATLETDKVTYVLDKIVTAGFVSTQATIMSQPTYQDPTATQKPMVVRVPLFLLRHNPENALAAGSKKLESALRDADLINKALQAAQRAWTHFWKMTR